MSRAGARFERALCSGCWYYRSAAMFPKVRDGSSCTGMRRRRNESSTRSNPRSWRRPHRSSSWCLGRSPSDHASTRRSRRSPRLKCTGIRHAKPWVPFPSPRSRARQRSPPDRLGGQRTRPYGSIGALPGRRRPLLGPGHLRQPGASKGRSRRRGPTAPKTVYSPPDSAPEENEVRSA